MAARFQSFSPAGDSVVVLAPGQRPTATFSSPAGERPRLADAPDVAFETADGVTYRPAGELPPQFEVVVETADSTYRQRYAVAGTRETGGVVGRVEGGGPVQVEIRGESGDVVVQADADGRFVANGLLPGPYTLRIWRDDNGDGRWTGGAVSPYRPPEPLRLLDDPIQVRARWETEVQPVTL